MARIRSIKADLFVDDSLADVSIEAHFLLAGLPVLADRAGRLEDRPRRIQVQIFPFRPSINVDSCLSELVTSGHVIRYEAGGQRYIEVVNWERDQRPHVKEAASVIPPPPPSYTEHRLSTGSAPASSGRVPGDDTGEPAGIMDSGCGVLDSRSGIRDSGVPLRGQGVLAGLSEPVEKPSRKKGEAKPEQPSAGGAVHQLRQRHAAVWAEAGRTTPLGLPVRRVVKPGENPVDFSREGQLWGRALGHARVAGAVDDAAAVALVLERLGHAAHLLKSVNENGIWVSRPKVMTLAEFVLAFHEASEDPRRKRSQSNIYSTAVSDWSADRNEHGDDPRTATDEEIRRGIEEAGRDRNR